MANRFEIVVMNRDEFWNCFQRTDLKFYDNEGKFGPNRWSYFAYRDINEQNTKIYILLHTKKSIENLTKEKISIIEQKMKRFGIDINNIAKSDNVIVCIDWRII